MADSVRVQRVAEQIRAELSQVLRDAVRDPRIRCRKIRKEAALCGVLIRRLGLIDLADVVSGGLPSSCRPDKLSRDLCVVEPPEVSQAERA